MDSAAVIATLDRYQPFDAVEAGFVEQTRTLLLRHPGDAAFSRETVDGHITASAFVLNADLSKALLVYHGKLNKWLQLGGHIELDEDKTLVGAGLREATEESGNKNIKPYNEEIFGIDVQVIPENLKKGEPGHLHYDINILLIAGTDDIAISEESKDMKWMTPDEARIAVAGDPLLNRMITKWEALRAG